MVDIKEIKKISLKSDDVLVVKINKGDLTSEVFINSVTEFKTQLKTIFTNNNIIFCDENFEFIAISTEQET